MPELLAAPSMARHRVEQTCLLQFSFIVKLYIWSPWKLYAQRRNAYDIAYVTIRHKPSHEKLMSGDSTIQKEAIQF